jgi:DNA-binding transcriptional ArsR family regulator
MHHLFQRPFDIFFAKSCSRLYNIEINGAPIIITSEDRFEYYKRFRDALVTNSELTGSTENCLEFSITRQVPYLDFREALPGCNTGREEIYAILYNSKHTFHDIMLLRQNLIDPLSGYLERTGVMRKRIALKDSSDLHAVSESLNEILYSIKTASHNTSVPTNKEMVIDSKARIDEFVSLFNSKATGAILKFCTGEITESEIAKATGMRLSNVSAHFKKMRAFGIVTSEKKPKIKIKRITLNLNYLQ